MASSPTTEKVLPYALLGMTAVTGLVDAVTFFFRKALNSAASSGNFFPRLLIS
jgi:uncharacterized membrane protein YoaK (UPF0700 family)